MTERPKRRPAAPAVGRQIKELEERLAHLEAMLADVRAEAGRSSGAARAPARARGGSGVGARGAGPGQSRDVARPPQPGAHRFARADRARGRDSSRAGSGPACAPGAPPIGRSRGSRIRLAALDPGQTNDMMRYVLFCPDGLLEDVAGTTTLPGDRAGLLGRAARPPRAVDPRGAPRPRGRHRRPRDLRPSEQGAPRPHRGGDAADAPGPRGGGRPGGPARDAAPRRHRRRADGGGRHLRPPRVPRRAARPARARARHHARAGRRGSASASRTPSGCSSSCRTIPIPTPSPPRSRSRPCSAARGPRRPSAPSAPSRGPRTSRCARSSRSRWRRSTRAPSISSIGSPWWTCSPPSSRSPSARWTSSSTTIRWSGRSRRA